MKKLVLTLVAMMTMTMSFAETENHWAVKNAENFEMNIDMRRLAAKLDLTFDQMEAVEIIQDRFNEEMQTAAECWGFDRMAIVHKAVKKEAQQMRRVLNDDQFNTYMMLLGTTLRNRGL